MESFLSILNHCIRSSLSSTSHRAPDHSVTSVSSNSSLTIDISTNISTGAEVSGTWRTLSPNPKYHSNANTPTNSRPPSPTPSLSSVTTTTALSPNRSKRTISSDEIREKILQHAFYLLEAFAKFDCGNSSFNSIVMSL
jgi:outer membrane protein assembly factor BamA